jgi:hypothetical protein
MPAEALAKEGEALKWNVKMLKRFEIFKIQTDAWAESEDFLLFVFL